MPNSSSHISPVTPTSNLGTSTVNPHNAPAKWASLLAAPAAPILPSRSAPTPEGEPSSQRRHFTFNLEVLVGVLSSGSVSDSGEDLAAPAES